MKMNIDELSAEISSSLAQEKLEKALPPRLAYRLRAFLKRYGTSGPLQQVKNVMTQKFEEALALKELKKNQVMASTYENSVVKLDFGSDVPESVKKSVMAWAKRRGLKATEASLTKSKNARSSITYATNEQDSTPGILTDIVKWEIS